MPRTPKLNFRNTRAEHAARARKKIGPAATLPAADVQIGLSTLARIARRGDPAATLFRAMLEVLDGCAEMLNSGLVAGAYVQGRGVLEHGFQLLYGISNPGLMFAAVQDSMEAALADSDTSTERLEGLTGVQRQLFANDAWRVWRKDFLDQRARTGRDPRWYSVNGGPRTLKELAECIALQQFYAYYSKWSTVVHGLEARDKHTGQVLEFDGDPLNDLIVPLHRVFCLVTMSMAFREGEHTLAAFRRDLTNGTRDLLRRGNLTSLHDECAALVDNFSRTHAPPESLFRSMDLRGVTRYNPGRAREKMTALMGRSLQESLNLLALSSTIFLIFSRNSAYDTHVARALLGLYRQVMESFSAFLALLFAGCMVPAAVQARSVLDLALQFRYLVKQNHEHLAAACLIADRVGAAWSANHNSAPDVPPPDDLTREEASAWRDLMSHYRRERRPVPWYQLLDGPRNLGGLLSILGQGDGIEHLHMLNRFVHRTSFVGFLSPDPLAAPRSSNLGEWAVLLEPCFDLCGMVGIEFGKYFRIEDVEGIEVLVYDAYQALNRRCAGLDAI